MKLETFLKHKYILFHLHLSHPYIKNYKEKIEKKNILFPQFNTGKKSFAFRPAAILSSIQSDIL